MADVGPRVTKPRLLLVEGRDEENLVGALLDSWGLQSIPVLPFGGKTKLAGGIQAALGAANDADITLEAIAVMRDADSDAGQALRAVRGALMKAGFNAPVAHGEVLPGPPAVGVFITPDGVSQGAIEVLCWDTIDGTPIGECCKRFIDCARDEAGLVASDRGKSLAHAFLATQEDPSNTVGVGAQKGYWDLSHAAFSPLKVFAERLAVA